MLRRKFATSSLALATLITTSPLALAQGTYPERPIRIVVPFPPGGQTDALARVYAERLTGQLRQTVVIDNKAGAAGAIGSVEVARSQPDGYTLLFGTASTHALYPSLAKSPAYQPLKDFVPIAIIGAAPVVFVARKGLSGDLRSIIDQARGKPGTLSYGSPGAGSFLHVAAERLKHAAGGVNINHVAYKGSGPAMNDLLAGHIDLLTDTLGTSIRQHEAGNVRILAVALANRSALASQVPTVSEALGLSGFEATLWNVVAAPAGTPNAVVQRIAEATRAVLQDAGFKASVARMAIEPSPHVTPESAAAFIEGEIVRWKAVVTAANITAE